MGSLSDFVARSFAEANRVGPAAAWSVTPTGLVSDLEASMEDKRPDTSQGNNVHREPAHRLIAALRALGPEGDKAAHFVEQGALGYPSRGGLMLADRLAADGLELVEPALGDFAGGEPAFTFRAAGELLRVADRGPTARVWCEVGP